MATEVNQEGKVILITFIIILILLIPLFLYFNGQSKPVVDVDNVLVEVPQNQGNTAYPSEPYRGYYGGYRGYYDDYDDYDYYDDYYLYDH